MKKSMVMRCLVLLMGAMTAVLAQALTADGFWSQLAENEAKSALVGKNIKNWTTLSSAEGKRLVESFGEEFLPNAFGRYEKLRDRAIELQQVFNEEFATPPAKGADTYEIYCKVVQRFAKARTDYLRAHVDLAYYLLQHKAGVVTTEELGELDEKPLDVAVFRTKAYAKMPGIKRLEAKQADFAAKFMPESFALHQQFAKEFAQNEKLFAELTSVYEKANALRGSVFIAIGFKADRLTQALDKLTSQYNDLYMQHRLGDKSADELAELDQKSATELKGLAESLPGMLREVTLNPCKVIIDDMVAIPGRSFKMGRTEVTQTQWERVMGKNPSRFEGADRPVENVSWDDCLLFIQKLNEMSKNVKFRLPTEEEWEYCCRAGSKGDWGKRANGEEGPLEAMGWYGKNSGRETHPVAQKEPNAWGLYDMHGNVLEWTSTADGDLRVIRGSSWNFHSGDCSAGFRSWGYSGNRYEILGFRLVSQDL